MGRRMQDQAGMRKHKNVTWRSRFNACPANPGSTFSGLAQLNHTYENIRFDFCYRARHGRVPEFVRAEEGGADGFFYNHDSRWDDEHKYR